MHPETESTMPDPHTPDLRPILEILRSLPDGVPLEELWDAFSPAAWPALFHLVDLGADLPRVGQHRLLGDWRAGGWPELETVRDDLRRIQEIVDNPAVPARAEIVTAHGADGLDAAARELTDDHCVHVDFLLTPEDRARLDARVEVLQESRHGFWGELPRDGEPEVYEIFERTLGSDAFGRLTGFDLERDEFTLTLSLQDLQRSGIGWHRDLYWPREWVGEDVFPVLYGLDDDLPERGGAFVYYVPWKNEVRATYRKRHQATVMWNSADSDGRLLHAVSGYASNNTARHLIILQCHRRKR